MKPIKKVSRKKLRIIIAKIMLKKQLNQEEAQITEEIKNDYKPEKNN